MPWKTPPPGGPAWESPDERGPGCSRTMTRRLTLLTDFGTRDGYVGAMKGVMAAVAPGVALDDISHAVEAGDVEGAALTLERYWDRYPPGTVHLVVVDPGVGTERRGLAVQAAGRLLVLPDNGVVTRVITSASRWQAVALENQEFLGPERSSTFHGRDVFAPAAAHLARGLDLERLGPTVDDPVLLPLPSTIRRDDESLQGQVIGIDRFGNLSTNLPGHHLEGSVEVEVGRRRISPATTYGEVEKGTLLALVNSDQRVEVAAREASAARLLGVEMGAPVRLVRLTDEAS